MPPSGTAAARNDLDLYDRFADQWWDPSSAAFRSLHNVKRHYLAVLAEAWGERLDGQRIADLGCGGGLLAIPLAERGAEVVGIDRSLPSLAVARRAAERRGLACRFTAGDIADAPLAGASCDAVVLSDVLEHVADPAAVIAECRRLLRPGGRLFVTTINRTRRAHLLAVTLAEGLGLVPRGTHDPAMFVRPAELRAMAEQVGLQVDALAGDSPRLWQSLVTRT